MIFVDEFKGKGYRVLIPTTFRKIVDHYEDTYKVRMVPGNTYLVEGNDAISNYLVDVVGYSVNGNESPVRLEVLD